MKLYIYSLPRISSLNFKTFAYIKVNEVSVIIICNQAVFTVKRRPRFKFNLSMNLFPSPETATPVFLGTPANPSCAVEGKEFTLEWNYALDGSLNAVQFSIVTGGRVDSIGSRIGAGEINSTQKYKARFRAQATSTRAELVIQAVQLSDEATFELTVVSSSGTFISNSAKVIVHCKYCLKCCCILVMSTCRSIQFDYAFEKNEQG